MDTFTVKLANDAYSIDIRELAGLDMVDSGDNRWHLLKDGTSYQIEVLDVNPPDSTISLLINNHRYDLKIEDRFDRLVEEMGLSQLAAQKISSIKAPMPGLILDVLVKPGDEVSKGSQLAVLEAMKMENILQAEGDGVVKSIEVAKGDAVDKGQVLIEME